MALLNLETCEREKVNALQKLDAAEQNNLQTCAQRDNLHEQVKSLDSQTRDSDRELSRLRSDFSSLQSNLNETVDQLNEKSKQAKQLKSQLSHTEKNNQALVEEVGCS